VRVWATFLKTHAAVVRQLEHELAEERGLPLSWYDVLLELNAAPERRLRMQELGERVVLSRTRVSRIVDEMVRNGLVAREPDPADRRATFAAITGAGRKTLRAAAPVYLRGIREHFTSQLSERELTIIGQGLGRVLEAQRLHSARGSVESPSPQTQVRRVRATDGPGAR
jgi:DNA-binding MarR family transcriptional regulator